MRESAFHTRTGVGGVLAKVPALINRRAGIRVLRGKGQRPATLLDQAGTAGTTDRAAVAGIGAITDRQCRVCTQLHITTERSTTCEGADGLAIAVEVQHRSGGVAHDYRSGRGQFVGPGNSQ